MTNNISDKIYKDLQDDTQSDSTTTNSNLDVDNTGDTQSHDNLKGSLEQSTKTQPPKPADPELDSTIINSINKYVDEIRSPLASVLDIANVTYEVAPFNTHRHTYMTINNIADTMIGDYAKNEYYNNFMLSLNKLFSIDIDFKYTQKVRTKVGIEFIQADNLPQINTFTEKFDPILDDEYSKYVTRFNNIISSINEDEYLRFINQTGIAILKVFKNIDAITKMSNPIFDDYKYSESAQTAYYNISQIPSKYIRYSREYPLMNLSKILIGCNQILHVTDGDLAQIAESDVLKQLSKIEKTLSSVDLSEMPDSIQTLYSDLSDSTVLQHIDELNSIRSLVFVINGLSKQIKYLNTALGVLQIKMGNYMTPEQFKSQQLAVKDMIYSFDFESTKNRMETILSQIDHDLLHLQPQIGIELSTLNPNSIGLAPEFISLIKLLLEMQKIYSDGVDKLNNVSTDSGIAAFFYPMLQAYETVLQPKAIDLMKIINDLKSNNADTSIDTTRLEKILNDPILLPMVTSIESSLTKLLLAINTDEFESDLVLVDHFFNIVKELLDVVQYINVKFDIDIANIKSVRLNILVLDTMNVIVGKFKKLISKIGSIGNDYNQLVSDNIKMNISLLANYVSFIGLNNISKCQYTTFDDNLLLYGVLKEYADISFPGLTLPKTKITKNFKQKLIEDINTVIQTKYSTLAVDLLDENIHLKSLNTLTMDYLMVIAPEVKDSSLKQEVHAFMKYLTIESSIEKLPIYSAENYDLSKYNIVLDAYTMIKSQLEAVDENDYRQAIYLAEEFKPELSNIVMNIPNDLPYSFDINTRYLQTFGYLDFDGLPYLEMLEYYEKMSERGLKLLYAIEEKTGNLTDILFGLAKSNRIELTENTIKVSYEEEDLSALKLFLMTFKMKEPQYLAVKNSLLYFKNHNSELLNELHQFKEVIKTKSKDSGKDVIKANSKYLDYYDQSDIDERTSPLTVYPKIYQKERLIEVIGEKYVNRSDYDSDQQYNDAVKDVGSRHYWEVDPITAKLQHIHNNITTVQQKLTLKYTTEGYKMRSQAKSYAEQSSEMQTYKKVCPTTKFEKEVYSNIASTKGYNPLLPLKRKFNDILTRDYEGLNSVYDPIQADSVTFPELIQISDDYSIYNTDYVITTIDNQIVQMVKVFRNTGHVYGITDVKFVGYGYIDLESMKLNFTSTLKYPMKLVDTTKPAAEYTTVANKLGYGNSSHIIKYQDEFYSVCNFSNFSSIGFIGNENKLIAVRTTTNTSELQLSEIELVTPDFLFQIKSYEGKVESDGFIGGVNNECNYAHYVKGRLADRLDLDFIVKDAYYRYDVDNHKLYQSPISQMYGMFVDTGLEFDVKLATGLTVPAYRVRSAFTSMPDYFLAIYDDIIKKYRLISPQMLHESESLRQQLFSNLDQNYALYDYNSLVLNSMLNLEYYPTPALANVNGFSNLYTMNKVIYFKGEQYNAVFDMHQDYVGFTDGIRIIFDQKLKPTNTTDIYSDRVKSILITSSKIK